MSKILKLNSSIELPNDEVVLELKMTKSGKIILHAPTIHPREVCKIISNVMLDLMFGTFQSDDNLTNHIAPMVDQ